MRDALGSIKSDQIHSNLIDSYVGSRVRLRRVTVGISQDQLGRALGISFQQIQKYENGVNRIGASRLFEISRALNVPISYFFDGMPKHVMEAPLSGPRGRGTGGAEQLEPFCVNDQLTERETLDLIRLYYAIGSNTKRRLLLDFMTFLASTDLPPLPRN